MGERETRTPALVSPLSLSGLEAVRLLARAGVRVFGYDSDVHAIGYYSRYCTPIHSLSDLPGSNLLSESVLLPVSDEMVWTFAEAERDGQVLGRWIHPNIDLLARCLDKLRLAEWASAGGIPCVQAWKLADLTCNKVRVPFPIVVKPRTYALPGGERARKLLRGSKVFAVQSEEQLDGLLPKFAKDMDSWVVQKLVRQQTEHPPIYVAGYVNRAGQGIAFAHRKLRTSPPHAGVGVYIESAQVPHIEGKILSWLAESGYRGIFGVELLYDAEMRQYVVVDFNPRFGMGDTIGQAFGINLPYIAYLDALGEQVDLTKTVPPKPVRWVAEFWDLGSARRMIAEGDLSLVDYLRSLVRRPLCYGVWDRRDPMPFLVMLVRLLYHRKRR